MATASQSLFNMSVAGGADIAPPNQTLLMPKLQYRFRVLFSSFGSSGETQLTRQVVDCQRPNLQFQKITLPVYNSTVYLAGKHTWNPIQINVRDDASGAVSKAVGEQVQKQVDFIELSSAASASDYKFQTMIDILDGGNGINQPVVLERWELYGCYLESANYNSLNYGTNEDVKVTLSISYDNAIQSPIGSGVGSPTPRGNPTGVATGIGFA